MKVLFLNASEVEGGAAKGAVRLLRGVRAHGVDARLLVRRKGSDQPDEAAPEVIGPTTRLGKAMGFLRPAFEAAWAGLHGAGSAGMFSPAVLPDRLPDAAAALSPDLVHLHWIAHGMIRLESLRRFAVPLVWTMHDSWTFTGGCHSPGPCTAYRAACGRCPVLGSSRERDLSRAVWRRKRSAWEGLDMTLVSPSRWLAASARASSLFRDARVEVIPNGLDLTRFRPVDRRFARDVLALPQDARMVLFGGKAPASDPNKGLPLLVSALRLLRERGSTAELVVFGTTRSALLDAAGLPARYVGWLHDDASLVLLYSAADVFVAPSLQENLPFTIMEAMACGTPSVAFEQGGVPDLIEHQRSGWLARPFEPADLARGIAWVLEDGGRRSALAARAREKAEQEFDLAAVSRRYVALYEELARRGRSGRT